MNDNTALATKAAISITASAIIIYFQQLFVPLIVLAIVVIVDWFTGLAKAGITGKVNSDSNWRGIWKKSLYLVVVIVGIVADWVIQYALITGGIDMEFGNTYFAALIVTTWLILNELLSIIENLGEAGVPVPSFLKKLLFKLKTKIEKEQDDESEDNSGN